MKLLFGIVVPLALVAIACAGIAFWIWHDLHEEVSLPPSARHLQVPRGESLDDILKRLADAGTIRSVLPLRAYLKLSKKSPIVKAGNYTFPATISPLGVLQKLEEGGQFERLTVVEGWNRFDIAAEAMKIPSLKLKTTDQAMALMNDTSAIKDLDPAAKNLEGYLFPDTYFILPDSTPQELIGEMVDKFHKVWEAEFEKQAQQVGRSPHDLVTIASIIETEAKLKEEQPIIASVIYNRLKINMPLSMDSTIVYASKLAGEWRNDGKVYLSDVERDSPYNTRKVAGLPPGPVGSPGLGALKASLNPAKTKYLYYVRNPARNDGAHNFYDNLNDFSGGVRTLRNWEREQQSKHRR